MSCSISRAAQRTCAVALCLILLTTDSVEGSHGDEPTEHHDGCGDAGAGSGDIETISASVAADGSVQVAVMLCEEPPEGAKHVLRVFVDVLPFAVETSKCDKADLTFRRSEKDGPKGLKIKDKVKCVDPAVCDAAELSGDPIVQSERLGRVIYFDTSLDKMGAPDAEAVHVSARVRSDNGVPKGKKSLDRAPDRESGSHCNKANSLSEVLVAFRGEVTAKFLGSYNTTVKTSAPTAYEDVPNTVAALLATGQTAFGYKVEDGDPTDDTAGFYYPQFLEFLDETMDTGIEVFAVVPESHQTYVTNRWGVDKNSSASAWAAALVTAATEFSALAAEYPHFRGMVIDDFGAKPCRPDSFDTFPPQPGDTARCYSVTEVCAMFAAAKSVTPSFKLYPTIYYPQLGNNLGPAVVLGGNYGVRMGATEFAEATYTCQLPSVPTTGRLSMLMADSTSKDHSSMDRLRKTVAVNDTVVVDSSFRGELYAETVDEDVTTLLGPGANTVKIRVALTEGSLNPYSSKTLFAWDVCLSVDGECVSDCVLTFDEFESANNYLDDKGQTVNNIGRIVATDNEDYRYDHCMDGHGAFVPFRLSTDTYETDYYDTLLGSARTALPTSEMVSVVYTHAFGSTIEPAKVRAQLDQSADVADGVMAWNLALAFAAPSLGIFSERVSNNGNFALMAHYPGRTSGLQGWYASWQSKNDMSGPVTVKVKDSRATTYGTEYFRKVITNCSTEEILYSDDISGNEGTEVLTFNFATPAPICLWVLELSGVGNFATSVYFDVETTAGTLGSGDFDYDSSSSEAAVIEAYEVTRDFYLEVGPIIH